jgi:hypothetical protein
VNTYKTHFFKQTNPFNHETTLKIYDLIFIFFLSNRFKSKNIFSITKFEEAVTNVEKFIWQMEKTDDKKLSKHLDLFQQQMQKAYQQRNDAAYKL